jgi:hypothetical protein
MADANTMKLIIKGLDREQAASHVRAASYVSLAIAIITLGAIVYSLFKYGLRSVESADYLDFCLMCGLAYATFKRSIVAVSIAFMYYLGSRAYHVLMNPHHQASYVGLILVVLFCYFYIQGIRGALALRFLDHRTTPKKDISLT